MFDRVRTGLFVGDNAPNGRVTVDSGWTLKETTPVYGNSVRGPYRYYTDGTQVEHEVPAIKSIEWSRSYGQDLASCKITLYNTWHEYDTEDPERDDQLGRPGYFWPKRGQGDSALTWNQSPGRGAYRRDGSWDPAFSWEDVLVEDTILRTYEGYGGKPTPGNYVSIDDNIEYGNTVITGVWIVNSVVAGSDGMLMLDCVDIGRLLLDQIVFPPLVPGGVYPLEYFPAGKSAFDSPWGLKVGTTPTGALSPGSKGEVLAVAFNSSGEGDSSRGDHTTAKAVDGDWDTFALSEAFPDPDGSGANPHTTWFDYTVGQGIDSLELRPWAGGYVCYVSVYEDGSWQGSENIPADGGLGIPYVKKINVPLAVPDNFEGPIVINLRTDSTPDNEAAHYAQRIRISFQHLYYSGIANGSGHQYRSGIRSLILYREGAKVSPYSADFADLWWTYAMERHPTRGYWVMDVDGVVYGYGDASDYDSTGFGNVPLLEAGGSNNRAAGMAAHPDGKGYWVVDWQGHVFAYGSADHHGEYAIADPYLPFESWNDPAAAKTEVWDIAATHTGNGYWVCYGNGVIRGFGDASPSLITIPTTDVYTYMSTLNGAKYAINQKATAIASHPHKMGLWVTSGSGEIFAYGEAESKGQLVNRVYNNGMASSFRLNRVEWATGIETTNTGNGYWIAFGSGRLAAFGDAVDQGPVDVYEAMRGNENLEKARVADETQMDWSFFRALVWDIARDPDGSGFWILTAGGDVLNYDADFWSRRNTDGTTGYRWHEGNFDGDWANIVKEILMWGGFTFYDPDLSGSESPSVLGLIESTGIKTDTIVPSDKFDKKTLIDVIKELTEVVGYRFRITEEGGAQYSSPNWWRAGNFDENGVPVYVVPDGDSFTRVDEGDPGAEPYIPIIHEDEDLKGYSVTLASAAKRSEIIIGTDVPDPKDPTRTGYVRHVPPTATEVLANGVPSTRGIVRPAIWVSQLFENEEERKLMAELIGLHSWFAQRTGAVQCAANPCLSPGDQVRLVERNTSETFIHLINQIDSSLDNDTGVYTMSLSTHWLGTADDWVITTTEKDSDYPYVVVSERLNSWQSFTSRGLQTSEGSLDDLLFTLSGGFSGTALDYADGIWEFNGRIGTRGVMNNFSVRTDYLTSPLGPPAMIYVYDDGDQIIGTDLPLQGNTKVLGNIGVSGEVKEYTYKITGFMHAPGSARLKAAFTAAGAITSSIEDMAVIVAPEE